MDLVGWVIVIPSMQCGEGAGRGARYLACVPDRCSDAAAFIASRSTPIDNLHYVSLFHSLSSSSKSSAKQPHGGYMANLLSGVAFCLLTEQ